MEEKVINITDSKEVVEPTPQVTIQPVKPEIETDKKISETPKLPTQPKKIDLFFQKMPLWQRIIIISILGSLILAIISLSIWIFIFQRPISTNSIIDTTKGYIEYANENKQNIFKMVLKEPSLPKTEVSPLNGLLFTKADMTKMMERKPVAVMINNHTAARPQSGLSKADIVYEAVAESGITRYMGIFWSQTPNKVGPIRSARQYYLEWLSEFDPIFIYDGCAQTDDPRTNACGNIYTYGIKNMRTIGAWRISERVAPHNEYSSIQYAEDYAKRVDWGAFNTKVQPLTFKRDAPIAERGDKTKVKIRFRNDIPNGGLYDTEWTYDKNLNIYNNKVGGSANYDMEDKTPHRAKVVVIQEVNMINANDGHARVIITTIGEGKAIILQDGKIIEGKWKKTSRTDRTKYYDSKGNEIALNRGQLWITALPKDYGEFDIIEK